jgi:hypothetical protein
MNLKTVYISEYNLRGRKNVTRKVLQNAEAYYSLSRTGHASHRKLTLGSLAAIPYTNNGTYYEVCSDK